MNSIHIQNHKPGYKDVIIIYTYMNCYSYGNESLNRNHECVDGVPVLRLVMLNTKAIYA